MISNTIRLNSSQVNTPSNFTFLISSILNNFFFKLKMAKSPPSFKKSDYIKIKTFKKVPSKHSEKKDLIFIDCTCQMYQFKRSIINGDIYYCIKKGCHAKILLRNKHCFIPRSSNNHKHPDIDQNKTREMKIIHLLRSEVKSPNFDWNKKQKWITLFNIFKSR